VALYSTVFSAFYAPTAMQQARSHHNQTLAAPPRHQRAGIARQNPDSACKFRV